MDNSFTSARLVTIPEVQNMQPQNSVRVVGIVAESDDQHFKLEDLDGGLVDIEIQNCPLVKISIGEPYTVIGEVTPSAIVEYKHSIVARICLPLELETMKFEDYQNSLFTLINSHDS